jgi:hypothetical protein
MRSRRPLGLNVVFYYFIINDKYGMTRFAVQKHRTDGPPLYRTDLIGYHPQGLKINSTCALHIFWRVQSACVRTFRLIRLPRTGVQSKLYTVHLLVNIY